MSKIRVVVADDHIYAVEGLCAIVESVADMDVAGRTTDVNEVVPLVERAQPAVVVLDLSWYGDKQAGVNMIPQIAAVSPGTRVVAVTVYPELLDLAQLRGALALGKGFAVEDLLRAIRWAARPPDEEPIQTLPDGRVFEALTPREREVLRELVNGASDKEIAQTLSISVGTVKKHVSNVLGKLGVSTRTEAAVLASKYQLAP